MKSLFVLFCASLLWTYKMHAEGCKDLHAIRQNGNTARSFTDHGRLDRNTRIVKLKSTRTAREQKLPIK